MTKKKQVNRKVRETKIGREKQKINDQQKKRKRLKICLPLKKTFCFICVIWGRYGFQSHDLSAAKLNAYGLKISAVTLIFDVSPTEDRELKLMATIARRGVARTATNIQNGELCSKCKRLLGDNYCCKVFCLRCFWRSWLRLLLVDRTSFWSSVRISFKASAIQHLSL